MAAEKKAACENSGGRYCLVIPVAETDIGQLRYNLPYWLKYLPVKRIVLIGKKNIGECLRHCGGNNIRFVDEDDLIPYRDVERIIRKISHDNEAAAGRTGWYLQQFLKMYYALLCEDAYYLLWDADTIPLRDIEMFADGHPVFDMKTEYWKPYFETMERLLPGLGKRNRRSYISEHMLINKQIMCEMLAEIENNTALAGESWYEKVLYAIGEQELAKSGFSEFETYGTYTAQRYPSLYRERTWKSCRSGKKYFDRKAFGSEEQRWLVRGRYTAVSFEKTQRRVRHYEWFHNKIVHRLISYRLLEGVFEAGYSFYCAVQKARRNMRVRAGRKKQQELLERK